MKRIFWTIRPRVIWVSVAIFMAIAAIVTTLVCIFARTPASQPANTTPESSISQQEVSSPEESQITTAATIPIPASEEVDDAYFSNTLFIGNSITEGFKSFSGLDTPTYYEGRGMTVESIHRMKIVNEDNSPNGDGTGVKTVIDALQERQFDQIYLLMGANELGWVYPDLFIEQYAQLIDSIRTLQPQAKLCVQSVLPVSAERSETDSVYNNPKINALNEMILQMAREKQVSYLNAAEAFQDETGALPAEKTPDGIHLSPEACQEWRTYIKTHIIP